MIQNKKIIIFTLDITISGGIERVVSNMAQYYSEKKYEIEIVSIFKQNKQIPYFIPDDVKVVFLSESSYNLTSFFNKFKSHCILVSRLLCYEFPYKATLLSSTTNITLYLILLGFRHRSSKLIAAEHGYYYAFGALTRFIRFLLYRFVDVVVTLTKSEKAIYDRFCSNVVSIPNSLSFYPLSVADFNNKRVISVGRLVSEKGYEELIPVYISLAKKYRDWEFVIFGSGYLESKLTSELAHAPVNVRIYPPTKNIADELLKSSIYVCSSKTEAFPMVLLEAQVCGLSIVSFDCPPGPREIITDSIDGVLISPNNFSLLSYSIESLINNPLLRKKYSENARKSALRFLPDNVFKLWDSILFGLICHYFINE